MESNSAIDSYTSCVPSVIADGIELGAVMTILKSKVSEILYESVATKLNVDVPWSKVCSDETVFQS